MNLVRINEALMLCHLQEEVLEAHNKLSFYDKMNTMEIAGDLIEKDEFIMEVYN